MMSLYEHYRPKNWADVVGQNKVVQALQALNDRIGFGAHAIWLTGLSGTGKTTLARLIAGEVADAEYVTELDAETLTPSMVQEIEAESRYGAFGKGGRVYIVNEAHGLKWRTVRQLLVTLERIPEHVCWIFTTTCEGQLTLFENCEDSGPLLSRCIVFHLARRGIAEAMATRLQSCARDSELDGQPLDRYVKLLYDCKLNMRAAWQRIETGELLA
ncbi:MAG: AAA family ATPase [Candidatus Hydrogenedentes bacterium]|nr:AAA family ATPase [Candidatus Hydrogenedentota bacterium]